MALINPRVEIEGYAINNRGYVNYKIYADDIISVDELADTGVKQQSGKKKIKKKENNSKEKNRK